MARKSNFKTLLFFFLFTQEKRHFPTNVLLPSLIFFQGTYSFEPTEYIGRWYTLANAPFFWQREKDRCVWANYTLVEDYVKVVKRMF